MLGFAQQHIAADRAFDAGTKAAVAIEQGHADAALRAAADQCRRNQHIAEADNAAEMMQRHAQPRFALHLDTNGVVVEMQISATGGDVQGVEQVVGTHGVSPWGCGRP